MSQSVFGKTFSDSHGGHRRWLSSNGTSASTIPARRPQTPVARGSGCMPPRAAARRNPSSRRPVHAGTGRGAVLPSGFARNSRRTPRPSSASTTASRSPSPTKTGLRAREVARLKLSTPSVSSERGNGCPPLPKVRVFRWTLPHSGLKMGTSVSGVPDIENA